MSYHWADNVHTTAFTPRDYQVELLASAVERNIMICVGHKSSKEFIALKLIQELAYELRNPTNPKVTVYLTRKSADSAFNLIYHLTDLKVLHASKELNDNTSDKEINFRDYQVIIIDPADCLLYLESGDLDFAFFNLLILEDCHETDSHSQMFDILKKFYRGNVHEAKVLALGGPLHSANCAPQSLKAVLEILEGNVCCKAETASDIVTVLRYCAEPYEFILQCAPPNRDELTKYLEEIVHSRKAFLEDHRYDPSEIYSDEFSEELKGIPDPKIEPLDLLNNYLEVLYDMGPWCADRVAHSLWTQLEKQKIKTPYERHFLLLSLISTTLTALHTFSNYHFQKIPNELDRIITYSTPKVIRLLEVLKLFKPDENNLKKTALSKLSEEIESLDFRKLEANLKAAYQTVENLENSSAKEIVENLETIIQGRLEKSVAFDVANKKQGRISSETNNRSRRNTNPRQKKRIFTNRRFNRENGDADSLCGIIFCNKKNTAIVIFDLLCVVTRNNPDMKHISVQYTVDRTADPVTEPKEAEIEHRRQEEVLKRFRTHESNILIGTSVLEEGIDLPKCNLVIRWDPPKTYRSYVQCKGRARASQAYHVILVSPAHNPKPLTSANEVLTDSCHRYICNFKRNNVAKLQMNSRTKNSEKIAQNLEKNHDNQINDNVQESHTNKKYKIEKEQIKRNLKQKMENDNLEQLNEKNKDPNNYSSEISNAKQNGLDLNGKAEVNCLNDSHLKDEQKLNGTCIGENRETEELIVKNLENIKKGKCPSLEEVNGSIQESDIGHSCKERERCNLDLLEQPEDELFCYDNFEEMENSTNEMIDRLAQYREIEKMLLGKCANTEPNESEHQAADKYTNCILPYKPLSNVLTGAIVDLGSSIALVNKYCAKLPSDTFTKLTPLFRCAKTTRCGVDFYQYTIRLPINSPMKYDIVGLPMPTKILARRMAALQVCRELHKCAELDDNLQPIGKEGFKAFETDWEDFELEKIDEQIVNENSEPRPGTTKRRQYYYKRIAAEFSNCRPVAGATSYLYLLILTLQCPIPEEQNTRGRKIYPPEDANQGFGILTLKQIPKVSSFPIFTRSGEVKVSIQLSKDRIILTEKQISRINVFLNYTFTNVLRLQKFLMLFDPEATENCVFIVPTIKTAEGIVIDWEFLETIFNNCDKMPNAVPDESRDGQDFDPNKFKDAVVMPWYRNQDQPQYFYVAEICNHLSPESSFPGENYRTFKEYYYLKYQISIKNSKQPLLDVDHTSARLNFLTPRYVNRKGVALPTSSEETKRAKRENLEQKQILVPELCTIHPFPASLWRVAVCLPCILYRINGLLLADDIRKVVSYELGLGRMEIEDEGFEWPTLDFGWSLSEVLKKCSKDNQPESDFNLDDQIESELQIKEKKENLETNQIVIKTEKSANDILEEVEEKLKADSYIEIGTWSNDMANNISEHNSNFDDDDDWCGLLPPNVNICSSSITNIRYGSPTSWDVGGSIKFGQSKPAFNYFSDSDESLQTDDGFDVISRISNDDTGPLRIEFKPNNVAEAIETEEEILKRQKQLSIIQATTANERIYQNTKNLEVGYNFNEDNEDFKNRLKSSEEEFFESTEKLKNDIKNSGMLVKYDQQLILPRKEIVVETSTPGNLKAFTELCPFLSEKEIRDYVTSNYPDVNLNNFQLSIDDIENLNRQYKTLNEYEEFIVEGCGHIFDNFNDSCTLMDKNNDSKVVKITYNNNGECTSNEMPKQTHNVINNNDNEKSDIIGCDFSFDYQPNLFGHPGPSPSIILQALTMSNANDGINLERLETIGDSFLKYAITTYLYITYENVHEGKLSHLRSKQVANLNLYRLGRKKVFGECMIATKFEPHDNWLPPCYYVPKELEKALIEAKIPPSHWNLADLPNIKDLSSEEICELVKNKAEKLGLLNDDADMDKILQNMDSDSEEDSYYMCFIPYNLVTQHSIPDKSVADCVEALIGAYLIECGPRGALLFMAWLGIRVLPVTKKLADQTKPREPGSTRPNSDNEILVYGKWVPPKCPLLTFAADAHIQLELLLDGFNVFEDTIGYHFKERSYLLQAMTHASYSPNRLTDCYQRLEFLGDAVLDYLITRHLYEDRRQHSPGALTDLRSALVNNTIFASLAVRHGFHKYFRHLSPGLNEVIDRFVRIQHENGHLISEEYYLMSEEECDDAEDVEVPKALGDVFESVAGAIFLDSNMSLDTVWKVYSNMMKPEIDQFSNSVPKSPIRELLELEPETAKFGKPEKLADGRRVRVTVEVFGKGTFRGIGRNYRIAKCTAAKCALRQLKKPGPVLKNPLN